MNKYLKIILFILMIVLITSLTSCSGNKRIEDLQKTVTDLQKQLSEKEKSISELQNTSTTNTASLETTTTTKIIDEKDETEIVGEVINNYINAVEDNNFNEQRKYVAKYALDLVNLKEKESKRPSNTKERQFEKQPVSDIKINNNNAEAYMSFMETLIGSDNSKYEIITEGKVLLEKISSEWKIVDYTRKNRLISEVLFTVNNLSFNKNKIIITVEAVFFSLFDKYVVVDLSIANNSDKDLKYYSSEAILIGPDKKQSKAPYYDENLENILAGAIASGEIQFDWNYDSVGNFLIHSGKFTDSDYGKYADSLIIEVDLSKSIKY